MAGAASDHPQIRVGGFPTGIALNPLTDTIYVGNGTAGTVSTFNASGAISVALPDGTPVGSTSGAPTVIPAGYYTVVLSGPGGCTQVPYFDLQGPGEHVRNNMTEGETTNDAVNAYFLPNSTYTWINTATPAIVYTFITSADVQGTPPAKTGSSGLSSGTHSTSSSQDVVGAALVPFRGTLTGAVSAAGRLTFAYKGKSVTGLTAGRYTIAVTDKSSTNGFILRKIKRAAVQRARRQPGGVDPGSGEFIHRAAYTAAIPSTQGACLLERPGWRLGAQSTSAAPSPTSSTSTRKAST